MSKTDDLKKIYNLSSELRFSLIQALNNNKDLHYSKTQFNRDMKSIQGVGEWALANMRDFEKVENDPPTLPDP